MHRSEKELSKEKEKRVPIATFFKESRLIILQNQIIKVEKGF